MAADSPPLRGRNALVVGGTRGIGAAISLRLAQAGARVIATYVRRHDTATALANRASDNQLQLSVFKADVSRDAALTELVSHVDASFDHLHALVFCAATGVHKPYEQLNGRHFDFTFGLNTRSFLELTHRLTAKIPAGGTIVAVSSDGAQRAIPTYALVGASKAALESLVRNAAVELADKGITVNALSPGSVMTEVWQVLPNAESRLQDEIRRSPRHRLVELDEVADVALFLCSAAARGISGQVIIVDGGTRVAG